MFLRSLASSLCRQWSCAMRSKAAAIGLGCCSQSRALALSTAAMLLLAWGKLVTGRQLSNPVLKAEARVTLIDAALARAVLLGVGLNTLFGWWWADPLAGLVIVYYSLKEGRAAWKHATAYKPATYDNGGDV
jgi:Co/Zn/Cd efflux system component